jgi:DNA repair photolyase
MKYAVFNDSNYPCINYTQVDFSKGCNVCCIYCGLTNNKEKIERLNIEKLVLEKGIPKGLYFSPNSDPFLKINCDSTHKILKKYLPLGVNVLIITKQSIPLKTIELLSNYSNQVIAKVSLARLDENLSNYIESGADNPSTRLNTLKNLVLAGLKPQLLIMPLFPGVDDTTDNIEKLILKASSIGVKHIKAAYVILRNSQKEKDQLIIKKIKENPILNKSFDQMTEEIKLQIGFGKIFPLSKRILFYKRINNLCNELGILFSTCSILDPSLKNIDNLEFLVCDNINSIYDLKCKVNSNYLQF